jgi:hypothetical protein
MITGIEAISAIGNVALSIGCVQFSGLRWAQLRAIADLMPSLAGRQVLLEIERLRP